MKVVLLFFLSAFVGVAMSVGTEKVPRQVATMSNFGSGTTMTASGGFYREKRQFYGTQNAQSIQNNQFQGNNRAYNGGYNAGNNDGGYYRQKRQFYGNQNAQNIQNNQFQGNNRGFNGGYNGGNNDGGYYRQKRQFYGNQEAKSIQNNQFQGNQFQQHGGHGRW